MATQNASDPPSPGQLLHADVKNHLKNRIRREVGDLMDSIDELRGLASTLEQFAALSSDSAPEALRETSTAIRAVATQTFVCASRTSGISTRLQAWADVAGLINQPENEEIPD
jgi:hypothetical protein